MTRSTEVDLARLYHAHSCHVRERPVETELGDEKPERQRTYPGARRARLPGRDFDLGEDLGEVLRRRRSVRRFALAPLSLETLGRICHASFGVRARRREGPTASWERPSPSAGGLYPLELHVATQAVAGLDDGLYHYDARAHELEGRVPGRLHGELVELCMGQDMVAHANLVFVITAVRERTMFKYGQRGYRFLFLDAGHLGQNLYLVATALGLGPVAIGGFLDRELGELMQLPPDEEPIYVVCVGHPHEEEVGR